MDTRRKAGIAKLAREKAAAVSGKIDSPVPTSTDVVMSEVVAPTAEVVSTPPAEIKVAPKVSLSSRCFYDRLTWWFDSCGILDCSM